MKHVAGAKGVHGVHRERRHDLRLPTLVEPGRHVKDPAVYALIVAQSRGDIATATDDATAARASVVARDPQAVQARLALTRE